MTEQKHTPEPWKVSKKANRFICTETGEVIAMCDGLQAIELDKANARRIVACINAMAGIDDDNVLFRRGSIGTVRKHIVTKQVQIEKLTAQRDQLRAALKAIADPYQVPSHGDPSELREYARAALAATE